MYTMSFLCRVFVRSGVIKYIAAGNISCSSSIKTLKTAKNVQHKAAYSLYAFYGTCPPKIDKHNIFGCVSGDDSTPNMTSINEIKGSIKSQLHHQSELKQQTETHKDENFCDPVNFSS